MSDERKDPIGELADSIKNNPVKSYIAYEVLVSDEKKKEIEKNLLGTVLIGGILIITIGCLVAPMFYGVLSDPIIGKILKTDDDNEREKLRSQLKTLKLILWIIAVVAWGLLIWVNVATDNLGWLNDSQAA